MRIALCQIPVSRDPDTNLDRARAAVADAAGKGADLAVFPEATLTRFGKRVTEAAQPLDGPFVSGLADAARSHRVGVIAGVFEPGPEGRVFNTAAVLGRDGGLLAAYRKIHLFDSFGSLESELVAPGDTPVVVDCDGLRVGLITCYDLRFPELARELVDQGADAFAVIAAWASGPMKEDHWVTLVRARAIENTMWTVAVGQPSDAEARDGFGVGRSLLVDPMGTLRMDLGTEAVVDVGEIDPAVTRRVRATVPSLEHRRLGSHRS